LVDIGSEGTTLHVNLWRARPTITYLKPPIPGGVLVDANFLDDGRLALQVGLPDRERQAWTLDAGNLFASQRLGTASSRTTLAVRRDGVVVATLQPRSDASARPSDLLVDHAPAAEVWLTPTDGSSARRYIWAAPDRTEELVDLVWAPDGRHLLVVGRQILSLSTARTVIRLLDTESGSTADLALLPSVVAPGTYAWSPDGQTVAFVARTASLAAVCTLSVAGDFRYLGDLGHDGILSPPVAPVSWSADGRVMYGGLLRQAPPSTSSAPFGENPAAVFLSDPASAPGRLFSSTPSLVPLWRPDGRILAIGLPTARDGGLRLREFDAPGTARDVATIDIPAPGPTAYGVRWDLARGRVLVVTNRGSNEGPSHDFWLVDFNWSVAP